MGEPVSGVKGVLGLEIETTEGNKITPIKFLEFTEEAVVVDKENLDLGGLSGSRSQSKTVSVDGTKNVNGSFSFFAKNEVLEEVLQLLTSNLARISGEENDQGDQLDEWVVKGAVYLEHTDSAGKIYVKLSNADTTRTVGLYKDAGLGSSDKIAEGSRSGDGTITLAQANSSGVTGSVKVVYSADDSDIYLTTALAKVAGERWDEGNQLSGWSLSGVTYLEDTDANGFIYVKLYDTAGTRTVELYKDSGLASGDKIAEGSKAGDGEITLAEASSSGVTGSVTVAYSADDSYIIITPTPTLNRYPISDNLKSFTLEIDRSAKVFTYAGCKVNQATFHSVQNESLSVMLELLGRTEEVGASGSGTAPSYDSAETCFVHHHLTMEIGGTSIEVREIELVINNMLQDDHFMNSQTRTSATPLNREITGTLTLDWNATNADKYTDFINGAYVHLKLLYTNGSEMLQFVLPNIKYTGTTPNISGREATNLALPFKAYARAADEENEIFIDAST